MVAYARISGEFCALLRQVVVRLGPRAFAVPRGVVQLYSGPHVNIRKSLRDDILTNWKRAEIQATRLGATRIDDTLGGRYLAHRNLEGYFSYYFGTDKKSIRQAIFDVWAMASAEFMKVKFRFVATAICGADEDRVFRKVELEQLVKNRHVQFANNRPMQTVRDFYDINPYEAFRLLCITELLEAHRHARTEKTTAAWDDYRERRRFFLMERQETKKYAPAVTADVKTQTKLRKRQILLTHRLSKIMAVTRTTMPLPIIPSAVLHRASGGHGISHSHIA